MMRVHLTVHVQIVTGKCVHKSKAYFTMQS